MVEVIIEMVRIEENTASTIEIRVQVVIMVRIEGNTASTIEIRAPEGIIMKDHLARNREDMIDHIEVGVAVDDHLEDYVVEI